MSFKVYINRTLNMKRIKYIGLDMDHTLIRYHSANFEALAHHTMLKDLVGLKSYPKSILSLKFDFNASIRGLVIDRARGNILKLSRFSAIRNSYHGSRPIDYKRQKELYRSPYIELKEGVYEAIDTAFSVAFAHLFTQLVDLKDSTESKTLPDYSTMASDVIFVLDKAHRDGTLKNYVRDNLSHYIQKDESTVRGLERYIKHGKKIFIATNSDFQYTKLLLDYAISPYLRGKSWTEIFEYVITSAAKPRFFYEDEKFLKIDPMTGTMTAHEGPLSPGVYQGGCASILTASLNLDPDDILYVGDHIYGDIVRLKKDCAWRTALVIEELEDEVMKNQKAKVLLDQINFLMDQKIPLERELDKLISEKIEAGISSHDKTIDQLMDKIVDLDHQISPLIKEQQKIYNPLWGEVMRVGIEESYFAYQVERFACIYVAKLTDLLDQSPRTYYRATKRPMPHELRWLS